MKKIFFVIFSIILFSVSFSETTYKVTTDKGVKLKKEEISQNNSQIEAQLAAFFNPQTYDADKIKKSVLNITDAPTKEEDILINSMSSFIKTYISNSKYSIEEINYSDAQTAKVTFNTSAPNIKNYLDANEQNLEKQAEKIFKTLSGKTVEQVDKDVANQDKYVPILMASFVTALSDNIGNIKEINTQKSTIEMKKVNGTWTFDERLINDLVDF